MYLVLTKCEWLARIILSKPWHTLHRKGLELIIQVNTSVPPSFNVLFKGTCFLSVSKCCVALKSQVEDETGNHRKRIRNPMNWGGQLGILLHGLGKTQIPLT